MIYGGNGFRLRLLSKFLDIESERESLGGRFECERGERDRETTTTKKQKMNGWNVAGVEIAMHGQAHHHRLEKRRKEKRKPWKSVALCELFFFFVFLSRA